MEVKNFENKDDELRQLMEIQFFEINGILDQVGRDELRQLMEVEQIPETTPCSFSQFNGGWFVYAFEWNGKKYRIVFYENDPFDVGWRAVETLRSFL